MEKLKDAVYGLAVGDALGVPVEFESRDSYTIMDMTEYGTHNQPIGTWSDDTSMTLATCYSIKNTGRVDIEDIKLCFKKWLYDSEFTATGEVFDIGHATLKAIKQGYGMTGEYSNGNGSLMRIIPLAFVENIDNETIEKVSAITHAHKISCTACVDYVNIAKELIKGKDIMTAVKIAIKENSVFDKIRNINLLKRDEIKSSGYVVDSFESAVWCVATSKSYEESVLKAVNLGEDTDTIGAISGGLAGIIYGYDSIPKKWIQKLKNKEIIEQCLF